VDERRIVAVRDENERPRCALDHQQWCEHSAGKCGWLEDRGFHRDEHLQVDRVIAIGVLDGDPVVCGERGRMRREVRVHRRRVMIVVIRVEMRVEERRAHGAALNGKRQPEREHAADHPTILSQNRMSVF
jgi:hypothetical protein